MCNCHACTIMIRIKYLRKGRKIPWQEGLRSGEGVVTHVMNHVKNLSTDLSAHAPSPLVSWGEYLLLMRHFSKAVVGVLFSLTRRAIY